MYHFTSVSLSRDGKMSFFKLEKQHVIMKKGMSLKVRRNLEIRAVPLLFHSIVLEEL